MNDLSVVNEKKVYYKHIFYIGMTVATVIFFIILFMTSGESARGILSPEKNQSFMDFFNNLLYHLKDPYAYQMSDPPLTGSIYKFLLLFIPQTAIDAAVFAPNSSAFNYTVKLRQEFFVPFILYCIVTLILLYFALKTAKKGKNSEKILFMFLAITSAPMLFIFERGNNTVLPLIFTLLFVGTYCSEHRTVRELSLIFLALAAATKIYPVLFVTLLLSKKRYKDIVKFFLYFLIFFVFPFFIFYNGTTSLKLMISNLGELYQASPLNTNGTLDFAKMFILPFSKSNGFSNQLLLSMGELFKALMVLLSVPALIFSKKDWKTAALCCCVIFGCIGNNSPCMLAFFFVPIILLLDEEKESSLKNYISLVLMILTVTLSVSLNFSSGEFSQYFSTKLTSYAVLVLTVLLSIDGLKNLYHSMINRFELSKKGFAFLSSLCSILVISAALFIAPGSIFNMIELPVFTHTTACTKNIVFFIIAAGIFATAVYIMYYRKHKQLLGTKSVFFAKKYGATIIHVLLVLTISFVLTFFAQGHYMVGYLIGFIVGAFAAYLWLYKYYLKNNTANNAISVLKTLLGYGITFIVSSILLLIMRQTLNMPVFMALAFNLIVILPFDIFINDIIVTQNTISQIKEKFAQFTGSFSYSVCEDDTKDKNSGKENTQQ